METEKKPETQQAIQEEGVIVYICGKVSGLPWNEVEENFAKAEAYLKSYGFRTINPLKLVNNPNADWKEAMRICIAALVQQAQALYRMKNWTTSDGAWMEYWIAKKLGMPVFLEELQK